ncbi:hypothetical protein E2C01_062566 [Portunus trituberculatus]|uniref:Uncharacterized protein n=1 Tax=Portunus trituberculatus TaxID=210409 RepID=A0A5B7HED5_PORTR|nr:hypothetical protein [Portunus trituberculatus]
MTGIVIKGGRRGGDDKQGEGKEGEEEERVGEGEGENESQEMEGKALSSNGFCAESRKSYFARV